MYLVFTPVPISAENQSLYCFIRVENGGGSAGSARFFGGMVEAGFNYGD